tara:strand:+ start:2413 stop:2892 length:480 start_codon:yes stop_codon:yes gene_type:complete
MVTEDKNLSFFRKEELPSVKDLRFGIVVSSWNNVITDKLYSGAFDTLLDLGVSKSDIITYHVPGSFELIFGANKISDQNIDAIICLGSIIRGETKHFDFVCNAVSQGVKDLNIILDIPVIFGVLTDDNIDQAHSRSGGKYGNKGIEAAITAIKMASLDR